MASPPLLQSNAARTEQPWTFYLAHYCGHMLQLCCRAFSFQYYRGQTGCDWLPLPEPSDYIQGLEPGHHEKCGANRNRTSCIQLDPEGSSGRVGYKFRRLRVMQVCYLKPSDARPSRDGYYGCRSDIDGLSEDWQSGGDGIRAGQICWLCWSSGCFSARYIKKKAQSFVLSTFKWKNGTVLEH